MIEKLFAHLTVGARLLKNSERFWKEEEKTKQETLWLIFHAFNETQQNVSIRYEDGNLQELRNC